MGFNDPAERRGPPGLAETIARVIHYLILIAIAGFFIYVIARTLPDYHNAGGAITRTEATIQAIQMALEEYRQVHGAYPPDRAAGLHADLDKPSECLVYYLSGGSICYVPGSSPSDYPWQHPVLQDTLAGSTGRKKSQVFFEFKASLLKDTDGDGIPEVVDAWGRPLFYNSGPSADGSFNQNGMARHNLGPGMIGKFDLISAGPDGKFGTNDDLHNWGDEPPSRGEYRWDELNKAAGPGAGR